MTVLFLDFETFYGDGYSLSLKGMTTEKYVRDERFKIHGVGVATGNGPAKWIDGDKVPSLIAKLPWHSITLVGHNLQFDGFILSHHFGVHPKRYIDTLALSRAVVGPHSARHGLKYVAEKLCGMTKMDELAKAYNQRTLSKTVRDALADYTVGEPRWNDSKQLYEAGDITLTREILKKMLPVFPKHELDSLDWTIRAFTDPKLYLDSDMLIQYQEELAVQKREALERAGLETRELLMSNDKYAAALESFGVMPPTKVNAMGKVTFAFAKTDEAHKELLDHPNPDVQALVAARLEHKSTIEETRTASYLDAAVRGAWPVGYNYAGASVTQRLSGNNGAGGNPQNLKRGGTLRKAIYAPEGYTLGVADLSQIEARIVLWLGMQITGPDGEEAAALKVMAEGGDIYGWFGERIYGYKVTKGMPERQIAKSAVLGLGYGMGWERFLAYCKQSGILIDERFAQDIVKLYRNTFRGVATFWRQCTKATNMMLDGATGYSLPFDCTNPVVKTALDPLFNEPALHRIHNGLYIKYPGLEKNAEGEVTYLDGNKRVKLFGGKVTENIVQAIAADIMRAQLTELNKYFPVVMTTHDELVCLISEADADAHDWVTKDEGVTWKWAKTGDGEFSRIARQVMTKPVEYMPGLPLDIESDTADRYGEAK